MKEKKTDRRVRYTLMVIRQSFVKLLKQKPVSKITIKEICEDADINRATFYAHYTDQYDLLQQIEDEIIQDINDFLSSYDKLEMRTMPEEVLEKILEYIKANAELVMVLLSANGDIKFEQEIVGIVGSQHFAIQADTSDELEYIYLFYATGALGIILKWLNEGMKKPIHEIKNLIIKLTMDCSMLKRE